MTDKILFKTDTIPVLYAIGPGGELGRHAINYMISPWIWESDDEDNVEKFRLCAEIVIPDGIDEWDADDYGYDELEREIIEQAKEHGLNPENIEINI